MASMRVFLAKSTEIEIEIGRIKKQPRMVWSFFENRGTRRTLSATESTPNTDLFSQVKKREGFDVHRIIFSGARFQSDRAVGSLGHLGYLT